MLTNLSQSASSRGGTETHAGKVYLGELWKVLPRRVNNELTAFSFCTHRDLVIIKKKTLQHFERLFTSRVHIFLQDAGDIKETI